MRIAGEDVPGLRTEESWAKVGERYLEEYHLQWMGGQYLLVQKAVDSNRDQ